MTPVFSKVGKVVWPAQTWDGILSSASMILDDGKFKAWYTAGDTAGMLPDSIGYATSSDGVTWSKYEKNPVLTGATEFPFVSSVSVVKVGSQYFMYYKEDYLGAPLILLATSDDGISWNKCPFPTIEGKPFKGMTPDVVFLDGKWSMWYGAGRQIRHAISLDGKAWTTTSTSLRIPGEYDVTFAPAVVVAGGVYSMWFYATFSYGSHPSRLFYATSTDGASWTTYNENPLPGETQFWHASVVTVGRTTYLWYTKFQLINSPDSNIYLATTTMPLPGSETTATQTSSSITAVASHTTTTASQTTVTTLPPTTKTVTWGGCLNALPWFGNNGHGC